MARPRLKYRERYASGRAKPEQTEFASPTHLRRMLDAAKAQAGNPLIGSELGRLRLNGVINDRQFDAGRRLAELTGWFDAMHGAPRNSPQSPSYASGMGKALRQEDEARTARRMREYLRVWEVLNDWGQVVAMAVTTVVIEDRYLDAGLRPKLINGLNAAMAAMGQGDAANLTPPENEAAGGDRILSAQASAARWAMRGPEYVG